MPEEKPFPFCGCILEAFYTNEMFDTVCVTYTDEHGVNRDWYMEVDETDERFNSLLKEYRKEVYKMSRDAGLSFITCPTAWIDSRRTEWLTPTHNSITPVEEMLEYDLVVAIGSDNIQDVYKPFSDGNMYTEVKFLLESLHLYDIDALVKIATSNGRLVIGMEAVNNGEGKT